MYKKRYLEEYEEGSELLWPSEKEDYVTRNFYRDLSHISKNIGFVKKKKLNLFEQILKIIIS